MGPLSPPLRGRVAALSAAIIFLLHADNYIPGNPMVTPPSIENKNTSGPSGRHKNLTDKNSSKDEILKLLEWDNTIKPIPPLGRVTDPIINQDFRDIMNGLFQAEGHIGGEFIKPNTIQFRPIVYISLNANLKSIELFKLLNSQFNNLLNYQVSLNKSGIYHIRIYTRNWNIIINKWIPYFNNCYGDKHRGLKILIKLYYLINNKSIIINDDYKIKFIYLVYNIVDNSQRRLSLNDKINLVLNDSSKKIDLQYLNIYLKSTQGSQATIGHNNNKLNNASGIHFKINIRFLLGFYLGDGTFNIYIRHEDKSLWYIPTFIISQKYTKDNDDLLNLIKIYLNDLGINSNISYPKDKTMVLITIQSIKNIKILYSEFKLYSQYYYNKSDQMYLLEKSCILLGKVKFWREANLILLSLLYNAHPSPQPTSWLWGAGSRYAHDDKNIINGRCVIPPRTDEHYIKYKEIINNYFNDKQNDNYFITLSKNKEWVVTLPIKIKPRQKYYTFINTKSEIIMDKIEALNLAKDYRNKTLKNWLIENKLI